MPFAGPSYVVDFSADAAAAKEFCSRPNFKQLRCGLAAAEEKDKTTYQQCPLCGRAYDALPKPGPKPFSGGPVAVDVVSLACQGRAVVRYVFKTVKQTPSDKDCASSRIWVQHATPTANPIVRCELELPSGPGSEHERAVRSKEGKCWLCNKCGAVGAAPAATAGCPSAVGRWYSDTVTAEFTGCAFNPTDGYRMQRVGIEMRWAMVEVAKFEVCNDPGCYDPAYEAKKLANARNCAFQKCN